MFTDESSSTCGSQAVGDHQRRDHLTAGLRQFLDAADGGEYVYRGRIENRIRHRNTLPSSVEAWTRSGPCRGHGAPASEGDREKEKAVAEWDRRSLLRGAAVVAGAAATTPLLGEAATAKVGSSDADALLKAGKFEQASRAYEEILKKDPTNLQPTRQRDAAAKEVCCETDPNTPVTQPYGFDVPAHFAHCSYKPYNVTLDFTDMNLYIARGKAS
jgi:tetratricopeptide (TPR) repeat protein